MTFEDKSGRWEQNRKYALGQAISVKFRDLAKKAKFSGSWKVVNWKASRKVSHIFYGIKSKFRQRIKNYEMVSRLKTKSK